MNASSRWPTRMPLFGAILIAWGGAAQAADPEPAEKPAAPPRAPGEVAKAIDTEIAKKLAEAKIPASPVASDAEFLRRVYLDITGKIPSVEKATAFLDSKETDKRQKLIEELLASPDYGRHFAIVWRDLIVRRDEANRALNTAKFTVWLTECFNKNEGWDKIVTGMLTAEGDTSEVAPTAFFMAHRENNQVAPNKLVGTTANLFLGVQLQCAECHKHPFIKKWKPDDFWGLAAFFGKTRVDGATAKKASPTDKLSIKETASTGGGGRGGPGGGSASGASIAIPDPVDPRRRTGQVAKAKFLDGEMPSLPGSPPYRAALTTWLTSKENKFFANAAVNRLWGTFFGRGIVNPIDDFQEDNPPSHPELLALLAKELTDSDYDLKHVVRCICNSEAYQRSSKPLPQNVEDVVLLSHMAVKVMEPEVLYDSLTVAMGAEPSGGGGFARGGGGGQRGPAPSGRQAFVNFFTTKEPGDDPAEFGYGIPQFLRLINSAQFNRTGPTIDKLPKSDATPEAAIETMFLATVSRRPEPAELKKFTEYMETRSDPKSAYTGAFWVLLNSAEFLCIR